MYRAREMSSRSMISLHATGAQTSGAGSSLKRPRVLFLAAMGLCVCALTLLGQATDGNLVGAITDATGAAFPDARVEITNRATNIGTSTKSNASGEYRFSNIPVGSYDLTVMAKGFRTTIERGVAVELNKTATFNVSLQVGSVTETVEVSEAAVSGRVKFFV